MQSTLIQRQYDDFIAEGYDSDPQGIGSRTLERVLPRIASRFAGMDRPLEVLDIGVGTGVFLESLAKLLPTRPHGLDLSERMIRIAATRLPDLVGRVDTAAHLDRHFERESFDLVCTHFVTGYVPLEQLAPMVLDKLKPQGLWSIVGGTKAGFPVLRQKTRSRMLRLVVKADGERAGRIEDHLLNPASTESIVQELRGRGFAIDHEETLEPKVSFRDFEQFMEFGWGAGWFAPILEAANLHRANRVTRGVLNRFFFPVEDHHSIAAVLARKGSKRP